MIRRSAEGVRADILVVLRDSSRLCRSHLDRKAGICSSDNQNFAWLLMNGYVRSYRDGHRFFFEITNSGCDLISQLSSKHFSRKQMLFFVKKNWRKMSDEVIADKLGISSSSVQRLRFELGFKKPGGYPQ